MPPWGLVIDDDVVPGPLLDAVRNGRGKSVPVLVGTTRNEFAWRGFRDQPDSAEARRRGQQEFADFDHSAFASFASTGNPGWPPFSADSAVMAIDMKPHVTHGVEFDA